MEHIVGLSGGKDSTALALALQEKEPRNYTYVCTPTGDELPEMVEHWSNLEDLLKQKIVRLSCGYSLGGLILKQRSLPNHRMRWCTRILKIEPFEKYVLGHRPCIVYIGIRADETDREGVAYESNFGVERRYPLVEWGWDVSMCKEYLCRRGIVIPDRTDCAMCFFQTTYEWYRLWRDHPHLFARAEAYESLTQHTFRYRNPLKMVDDGKWSSSLIGLRNQFESGMIPERRVMKDRQSMCSVCAR